MYVFFYKVYTQAQQEAIVNARNEAAAQAIPQIQNNTKAALAALVIDCFVLENAACIVQRVFLSC